MDRVTRFYGEAGIPYVSAEELFTIDGPRSKRILVDPADNYRAYFVQPGWVVIARSGQVYGLIGSAMLVTPEHRDCFFSDDLIRIVADESRVRPGYLVVALTHRTHGRPLLIRAAYGTSIPHLDPVDVADFPVVRLGDQTENGIAELSERAAHARSEAEVLEHSMAVQASGVVERFMQA